MVAKWPQAKLWIYVTSIVFIVLGSITLILQPDEFSIILKDGAIKATYSEGNLKVYSGRYVAFEDYINLYYWNGKGYISMYKARGNKYSNLSYFKDGDTTFVKQTIYYSQGNLTRYFEITEYRIKESFEWDPNKEDLRVYFLWTYGRMDELQDRIIYVDRYNKKAEAMMDFDIINNWEKEMDNIVRVDRYKNGRLKIRTRIFEGKAVFDPEIVLKKEKPDVVWKNNNMTVEFKEGNKNIGQATLKSHVTYDEIKKVTIGKNRTVIWYEFSDFKDIQVDALKGVEFIDMREKILNESYIKQYNKNFEVIDESKVLIPNPDYLLPIEKNYRFVYKNGDEWLPYNSFDIPKENIIIGVQIDLGWGEVIDVVFDIFDNKLDKHGVVKGVSGGLVTTAPTENPAGNLHQLDDRSIAYKVTTSGIAVNITEIGWWCNDATQESNFEVAIYAHNSGNDTPGNIVGSKSGTNAKGTDAGWKKATGLNISVSGNTIYWIAVQLDNTATTTNIDYTYTSGERAVRTFSQTTLTDPWTYLYTTANYVFAIYAVWGAGPDTNPPTYSDNSTNSTTAGADVLHSLTWTDDGGLATSGGYVFSFDNGTGTLINDSWLAFDSNPDTIGVTKTINSTTGATIRWCVHANDTSTDTAGGNWNSTSCVTPFSYVTTECSVNTDCGLCEKCTAGSCVNQTSSEDLKSECSASYDVCVNEYTRQGPDGYCDGSGACDTDDATTDVSAGNVCDSGGDVNPTAGINCGTWADCIDGNTSADEYWVGYTGDGTDTCVDTDWQASSTYWNCTAGYTIDTTEHADSCSEVILDLIPPTYSDNSTNSTLAGKDILHSLKWIDTDNGGGDAGLISYTFSWYNGKNWTQTNYSGDKEAGTQTFSGEVGTGGGVSFFDAFESGTNWTEAGDCAAYWNYGSSTPSGGTGPQSGDSDDAGNNFVYMESSSGSCDGSPSEGYLVYVNEIDWDLGTNDNITFETNRHGDSDLGTMRLQENSTGTWLNTSYVQTGADGNSGLVWTAQSVDASALTGTGYLRFWGYDFSTYLGDAAIDKFNITSIGIAGDDIDSNKTAVEYLNALTGGYQTLDNITVTAYVSYYNTSGSVQNSNTNATLWLEIYNGTDWLDEGSLSVTATGNFSKTITTASILTGWQTEASRDIKISARMMDYNSSTYYDTINWTGTWAEIYSHQEYLNDSAVSFSGILNWSNVTKTVSSTVGHTIKWKVHANDTSDNWNNSETFSYVTTSAEVNTAPTIQFQNSFINCSTGHCFNVTAGVNDADGGTDITATNISSSSGSCDNIVNSTSGNYFNSTWNCSGDSLASTDIIIGFTDSGSEYVNTTQSSNIYPNQASVFDPALANQTANSDVEFTYDINATDADEDTLIYYDNTSLFNINSNTGIITDTPTEDEAGTYTILISVSDGSTNITSTFDYTIVDKTAPTISWTQQPDLNYTDEINPTYLFNISDASGVNHSTTIFYKGINDTHYNDMNWSWRYPASAKQPDSLRACNRNESDDLTEDNAIKLYPRDIVSYGAHRYSLSERPTISSSGEDWTLFNFTGNYHHMLEKHIPIDRTGLQSELKTGQYIDIYKNHPAIIEIETFPVGEINKTMHFEFNIDDRNGTESLLFYGCNDSIDPYTVDYETDSNCGFFGTITDFDTKDRTTRNSSYVTFHVGIDENGTLNGGGDLKPSDRMFVFLETDATIVSRGFKLFFANNTVADNTNFNETYFLHTYEPNTWTNRSETPDVIFQESSDHYQLQYYVHSCDNASNCVNFTIQLDLLGEVPNLPPEAPYLIQPVNGTIANGTYNITWLDGSDPDGDDFNITLILINHTDDSEYTLTSTVAKGTEYYLWDTTVYTDGRAYQIVIYACDAGGCSVNDTSEGNFTINNLDPDLNLSFGPDGTSVFRFIGCGPNKENTSSYPENQNSTHGIDYICNNGTESGDVDIKLSGALNTNWTISATDTWGSGWQVLTTSYQGIKLNLTIDACQYIWFKANCSYVTQNPGGYEVYQITDND